MPPKITSSASRSVNASRRCSIGASYALHRKITSGASRSVGASCRCSKRRHAVNTAFIIYQYVCMHIHTYIYMYVCVYVSMYVHMYVCMNECMNVCMKKKPHKLTFDWCLLVLLNPYKLYILRKVTFDWCLSQLVVAVRLWSRNDQWRSTRKWGLEIRLWVYVPSIRKKIASRTKIACILFYVNLKMLGFNKKRRTFLNLAPIG